MPVFEQAQAGHPDVHFVFLNQGESPRAIADYLRDHAPGLRNVLRDGQSQARARSATAAARHAVPGRRRQADRAARRRAVAATLRERLDALKAANGSEP